MTMTRSLRALCLAVMLALPWFCEVVRAQDDSYLRLLRDGVEEFGLGNWGEARLMFLRAHEIAPTARTYRGLGLCDYELRHYVDAIAELEAALSDPRRPLTPELRSQVEPVLGHAREYVARYKLRLPAGVTSLDVDGKSRQLPANGELLLDPGEHTLQVKLSNAAPIERAVTANVGAREELTLLPPSDASVSDSTTAAPPPLSAALMPTEAESVTPENSPRVWTWVAAGLTGAFGAGVVGFGLAAHAKNVAYKDQARMGVTPDAELKRTGQTFETLTNISIVGCALSGAAAVTLFFVEGRPTSRERSNVALQAGVTPTGAYVRARF
jgi:hypothetical protein